MGYTIKQVSDMTGLSEATLRFYDKEGLFPNLQKKASGYRVFTERELDQIKFIECFKNSGFEVKDIKRYFELIHEGDKTLPERLELMKKRRECLLAKKAELEKSIRLVERKVAYYEQAVKNGTEKGIVFHCEEEN